MKLTEIEPYSGYGKPVYHRYLEYVGANDENQSGKSDKFWEVAVFQQVDRANRWVVVRRWGRYGKKGQIKVAGPYGTEWSATGEAQAFEAKKRVKGYTREIDVITRLGMRVEEGDAA